MSGLGRVDVEGGSDDDFLVSASRALFLAGSFFMPMLIVRLGGTLTFGDILFLLSVMIGIPWIAVQRRAPVPPLQVAIIGLLIAMLVSLPVSHDKIVSLLNGLKLAFVWGLWVWQARALLDTKQRLHRAMAAFAYGAAVSALFGVGELAGFVAPTGAVVLDHRASGLTGHPNDQGAVLAVGLVIAFGFAVALGRKIMFGVSVLVAAGLVVSGSLSGMAGAIAGVVTLAFRAGLVRRYGSRLFALCVVGLVGAVFLLANVGGFSNPLDRLNSASSSGPQGTVNQRWDTITAAWRIIPRHFHWLTGVGIDEKSSVVYQYYAPHNALVLALLQGGVALLVAICAVIFPLFRYLIGPPVSVELAMSLGVLVAGFGYAMTAPVSYQRYAWLGVVLCYVSLELGVREREMLSAASGPQPEAQPLASAGETVGRTRRASAWRPMA